MTEIKNIYSLIQSFLVFILLSLTLSVHITKCDTDQQLLLFLNENRKEVLTLRINELQ